MIVANFMQHNPISIAEDRPIRDAVRLIFNLGVSAVLVVKEKKPIGIITEEDILQRLFPSVKDFMEDFALARSFVMMEERLPEIMGRPVKNLMTSPVKTISKETPLMKALSMMLLNNFSHIPVVNEKKELSGIISQGDIFRAIASSEIPYDSDEEYHDWIARHFDVIGGSRMRYEMESETLDRLFKKHQVKNVLNIGAGTGSQDLLLAEKGYHIVGLDKSRRMYATAMQKRLDRPVEVQNRVEFHHADSYEKAIPAEKRQFDAVLFMGNALPHIPFNYEEVLSMAVKTLKEKDSVLVLELANVQKVLGPGRRLQQFTIAPSRLTPKREFAFVEFYDPIREGESHITNSMVVLAFNGRRWSFRGINSTPLAYLPSEKVEPILRKLGFHKISVYGSRFGEPIMDRKPNYEEDDWITIVAEK